MTPVPSSRTFARATLAAALCILLSACLQRRLDIRSEPPGATVLVNGEEIGQTPVEWPFVYYGTVRVDLWSEGYRPVTAMVELTTPWYEWVPLDLFSELLVPVRRLDLHEFTATLEPLPSRDLAAEGDARQREVSPDLLDRADQHRRKSR